MPQDIEPRQVIYNRTGLLSETTTVDQGVAQQFMAISDLNDVKKEGYKDKADYDQRYLTIAKYGEELVIARS